MKTDCPDCCYPEIVDNKACGCCEGIEVITPRSTANRPGLSQLSYRIGSHSSFLESMIARLSSRDYPQLAALTTRDADDASIALLDGWATVADVLTFYQERIANEGYLRCATERRSILELAKLVGYKLRPGVSSSVFLAYTIDENTEGETIIPARSRVQSVPGPDELPQAFETIESTKAQAKWNNLKPRMTQPQTAATTVNNINGSRVYLKGINTNIKSNDPLLISTGGLTPLFYRAQEVTADATTDRTLVTLQTTTPMIGSLAISPAVASSVVNEDPAVKLIKDLTLPPTVQPASALRLKRHITNQFKAKAETGYMTVGAFTPLLRDTLATASSNIKVTPDSNIKIYALRVKASLFGNNHPGAPNYVQDDKTNMIKVSSYTQPDLANVWPSHMFGDNNIPQIAIDPPDEQVTPGSWIVIGRPILNDCILAGWTHSVHKVNDANPATLSSFGISSKVSLLNIEQPWLDDITDEEFKAQIGCEPLLRDTSVYCLSEELELAEEPIETTVCGGTDEQNMLELDDFYEGLESGRWVIVSGERDIAGTSGVRFSELAMLASVTQDVFKTTKDGTGALQTREGEKNHTFIQLAEPLQYCFKRDSVTIYGNVVKANNGETRNEVLGSGNGSKALQTFELKQSPLTHVSASNPTGVDSTLSIFVNGIKWHEMDSLAGLLATDRNFITTTNDDDKTSITFGNGKEGLRLPTGVENIRAEYRNGIGKGGNVNAEQISMLVTKPLGVKEVINPLRASGGADRENRDQARKSAPLAVMALDRLVSVRDYKDFARLYAGIGKSTALEISNGHQQLVHVTIAGADGIPIDETSDLFLNLRQALLDFGDPYQPLKLAIRELMFIVISANVKIKTDYQWEPVVAELRATLLDTFGFEQRELGQDVVLSEVIGVMQSVRGIEYVDIDVFGGIPEKIKDGDDRRLLTPDEIAESVNCFTTQWSQDDMEVWCDEESENRNNEECIKYTECKKYGNVENIKGVSQRLRVNLAAYEGDVMRPAQLAFLTPDVPDTLILNQIK